jgi:hypothetical protein
LLLQALRHSKVKLTWDQDDPNRIKLTRRTLTRDEIEEEDFKNLIASSGSEDEDLRSTKSSKLKSKKGGSKDKNDRLRALLLAATDEDGDVWGKAGTSYADVMAESEKVGKGKGGDDMEITFRPGLSEGGGKIADEENLTSLERYQLRVKERKARKKEKIELKRAGQDSEDEADAKDVKGKKGKDVKKDDFFAGAGDSESEQEVPTSVQEKESVKAVDVAPVTPVEEEEAADGVDHFSMKDILKAEKEKGKKRRRQNKGKKGAHDDERETELGPEGWKINVKDERFKVLHEEPEFAIDPSNPRSV